MNSSAHALSVLVLDVGAKMPCLFPPVLFDVLCLRGRIGVRNSIDKDYAVRNLAEFMQSLPILG